MARPPARPRRGSAPPPPPAAAPPPDAAASAAAAAAAAEKAAAAAEAAAASAAKASARPPRRKSGLLQAGLPLAAIGALSVLSGNPLTPKPPPAAPTPSAASVPAPGGVGPPVPLLAADKPVDWWFAYKFSSNSFPGLKTDPARACPFGGKPQTYAFSQKYAVASSVNTTLTDGPGLIGTSGADPLGATFGEIYNGKYYFVVWNDQFKGDPSFKGKTHCDAEACDIPWGHSKGVLAWDASGAGVLLQVSTPSWPGAGGAAHPRPAGNTLGCVGNDNDVSNAQHFFALKLSRDDVKAVLAALTTASVATDVSNPQLVNQTVGGQPLPADMAALVAAIGKQVSPSKAFMNQTLSSGVRMIVKPSALHVPPWQFVSSQLGGEPLLSATWWANPSIASTRSAADVHCWDASLTTRSGEVDVALSATWDGAPVKFTGGPNHAKVGVSLPSGAHHYAIFGDLNQQGELGDAAKPDDAKICDSSQNSRGGMFFVVDDPGLAAGVSKLLTGTKAPYPK